MNTVQIQKRHEMKKHYLILFILGLLSSCGVSNNYKEAKSSKSILAYENYISKYPRSKYLPQAKEELNDLYEERDWNAANQANKITVFERFISDYPCSEYRTQAESKIRELEEWEAWSKCLNINTIYAYENFINAFPVSRYTSDAKIKIEQLEDNHAWQEAESIGTVVSYKKYLADFPRGSNRATATYRIEEIEVVEPAWNRAVKENTPLAYQDFLDQYSNSSFVSKVREKLLSLEIEFWRQARTQRSITLYQKYLDNFPAGSHVAEAEKAIIDIEVDDIFKGDHGLLPPMSKASVGFTNSTTNHIEIYNNTSYTLTVRYSGSIASKKIVLKPKQKQTFTLQNGNYRVAASVNATNVNNYAGDEKLEGGRYTSEYYIKTESYWE